MADFARLFENFENVSPPKECQKTGEVPEWLNGSLLRNGPGMFRIGDTEYKHWFDGMAYVQRYHFEDGKMFYSAKFLESEDLKANLAAGRIVRSQFGTYKYPDPCKTIFHRFFSYFFTPADPITENCGVAFTQVGDAVYALTEVPNMMRIDTNTLDKIETSRLSDYVTLNTATAHPHNEDNGDTVNCGTRFGKTSNYVFAVTKNPLHCKDVPSHSIAQTSLLGELSCQDPFLPTYYHSFGMSRNHVILIESPLRINVKKLLVRDIMGYAFRDTFSWHDEMGTKFRILNKETGKELDVKVKSEAFFTFHHANSFEKDGCVVVDYCRMNNPGDLMAFSMENMRSGEFRYVNPGSEPFLHRMVIPLTVPSGATTGQNLLEGKEFAGDCTAILNEDGSVTVQDMRLCDLSFEFPRYNYGQCNMRDYQFVYGTNLLHGESSVSGVVKCDVISRSYSTWDLESPTQLCGEPIFVPTPGSNVEDDGILLVPVMTSSDGDNPWVAVLDAKTMSEMARFSIPESRIPLGFHGFFHDQNTK